MCQTYKDHHSNANSNFNLFDIFKYRSLIRVFIPLALSFFVGVYLFLSPSMIIFIDDSTLFVNNMISGISYLVSIFFVYSFSFIKRKHAGIGSATQYVLFWDCVFKEKPTWFNFSKIFLK